MTIHQAKELMRISKLKSACVRVDIKQHAICAKVEGSMYYYHRIFGWCVSNSESIAVVLVTDKVDIKREGKLYIVTVYLTGRRVTYAKNVACMPVIEMLNGLISQETTQ